MAEEYKVLPNTYLNFYFNRNQTGEEAQWVKALAAQACVPEFASPAPT